MSDVKFPENLIYWEGNFKSVSHVRQGNVKMENKYSIAFSTAISDWLRILARLLTRVVPGLNSLHVYTVSSSGDV